MPDPLPLKSLNHIGLTVCNAERSTAFFRDVLGFREVARPAFNFAGAWMMLGDLMIHIIESSAVDRPDEEIRTRENHLAVHTDDLEAVERLLGEHGIPFRKSQVPGGGAKQIFFRDPDGHHIEIGSYPPHPATA